MLPSSTRPTEPHSLALPERRPGNKLDLSDLRCTCDPRTFTREAGFRSLTDSWVWAVTSQLLWLKPRWGGEHGRNGDPTETRFGKHSGRSLRSFMGSPGRASGVRPEHPLKAQGLSCPVQHGGWGRAPARRTSGSGTGPLLEVPDSFSQSSTKVSQKFATKGFAAKVCD